MTTSEQIALWADKLRDISAMGLRFSLSLYDEERYRAVQDVALALSALAGGQTMADLEPLRASVFARPTPLVGGDAGIIDDCGRILLIRRADNGRWAMPGGALEVGETPAEGVVREVLEETGVQCQPVALVGVFDSRRSGLVSRHHLYVITFLCRPLDQPAIAPPSHALEALATRWFGEEELPADLHPGTALRIPHVFHTWRQGGSAFFDS